MNDQGTMGTFDRLVISLESGERQQLLKQLADISELQQDPSRPLLSAFENEAGPSITPDKRYLDEPLLVRLWFMVIGFFTSSSPTAAYSSYLVKSLGDQLSRRFGQYIIPKQRMYTQDFYTALENLDKIKAFFSSLLASYENDKGGFYVVLASLMMEKTIERLNAVSDPFKEPYDREPNKDLRLSFTRNIDGVFKEVPDDERVRMYQSAQAIEWMKNFCDIPFDRMLMRFGILAADERTCMVDSIGEEMRQLVNVLAGAGRIPLLMLEAMYLFGSREKIEGGKFDLERECSAFVKRASDFLSGIRLFKSSVPCPDLVRFTLRDVCWQPSPVEGGEDWFMMFKNAWKKKFDDSWTLWNRLHRKAMLQKRVCSFLETDSLPTLSYHPWEGLWLSLSLKRELSWVFVKGFFSNVYPKHVMKPLKILLIEGDFYRRENMAEFTDAFSTLEHQEREIADFEQKISPKGVIGEDFQLLHKETVATAKGKARLENLMLSVESEIAQQIGKVLSAFRSVDLILAGIIGVVRGAPYETLINMASIQGKQNEKFRKELAAVKQLLRTAAEILSEIELVEKDSL